MARVRHTSGWTGDLIRVNDNRKVQEAFGNRVWTVRRDGDATNSEWLGGVFTADVEPIQNPETLTWEFPWDDEDGNPINEFGEKVRA